MVTIESIVCDPSLEVSQKSEHIVELLAAQPDHGVADAVACLLTTDDERVAAFVADYLQDSAPASPLFSVSYAIAAWRPERLRPHAAQIDHPLLRRGMLSGAPEGWVADLVARWHAEHDPDLLDALARIRTPAAADALLALHAEIDDRAYWEILIASAGLLPDGHGRSWCAPAFLGFVVERERTPHIMGRAFPGDVPICPVCDAPTERVLTLDAGSLPFRLRQNPSFSGTPVTVRCWTSRLCKSALTGCGCSTLPTVVRARGARLSPANGDCSSSRTRTKQG